MKSFMINNENLHTQLKILSARSKKSIIELLEEAIKLVLEKYHE